MLDIAWVVTTATWVRAITAVYFTAIITVNGFRGCGHIIAILVLFLVVVIH